MADIVAGINPTRMELIKLRRKIALASKGHRLLKEKRDALVMEFLKMIRSSKELRENVDTHFQEAFKGLVRAQAVMGSIDVKSAAMGIKEIGDISFDEKNIIGVRIPKLSLPEEDRSLLSRGYSPLTSSATLDEASRKFEEALKFTIEMAETEKTLQLLGREVERTKRRVNALEYVMIPRLKNTALFIQMRLDEMEREDFSRLKKIKSKLSKR